MVLPTTCPGGPRGTQRTKGLSLAPLAPFPGGVEHWYHHNSGASSGVDVNRLHIAPRITTPGPLCQSRHNAFGNRKWGALGRPR